MERSEKDPGAIVSAWTVLPASLIEYLSELAVSTAFGNLNEICWSQSTW